MKQVLCLRQSTCEKTTVLTASRLLAETFGTPEQSATAEAGCQTGESEQAQRSGGGLGNHAGIAGSLHIVGIVSEWSQRIRGLLRAVHVVVAASEGRNQGVTHVQISGSGAIGTTEVLDGVIACAERESGAFCCREGGLILRAGGDIIRKNRSAAEGATTVQGESVIGTQNKSVHIVAAPFTW